MTLHPPLRIAIIAPIRYPIAQPHAGGLESSIWNQVVHLRRLGHTVLLCAIDGSDFLQDGPPEFTLPAVEWPDPREATDITYPAGHLVRAFRAMERALQWLADHSSEFDIVDNHCLHGLPLEWTGRLGIPMVTNLHTPVLPDLLAANGSNPSNRSARSRFIAVGRHTADEWRRAGVHATIIPNGVDESLWPLGKGGDDLVWFGRIVAEKAPHLAIQAAQLAGRAIVLAGRIGDERYFDEQVRPLLGTDVRYVGSLRQPELAQLVGNSSCALVTPVWEEPFGLVIAEAQMTGTPVATFDVGGIPEVVAGSDGAVMVPTGDVGLLATAVKTLSAAAALPGARQRIRSVAVKRFSAATRTLALTEFYREMKDR